MIPKYASELRAGDTIILSHAKYRTVQKILVPCCRTKVHLQTDSGQECYDHNAEVWVR